MKRKLKIQNITMKLSAATDVFVILTVFLMLMIMVTKFGISWDNAS